MKGKLFAGLALASAFLASGSLAEAQGTKPKRVQVAVMDFDYGTIDNWWGQYDIGKGMADQVVDFLVNDGTFSVIERKKLDTLLAEQDFAHSNRADPNAATLSKIGKIKGVKFVIAGSITKFSTEKRGGGLAVHGIGVGGSKGKAQVNLTARVIDVTTGEIVASVKGEGISNKGGGFNFATSGVAVGTHSDEWRNSAIGDAQEKACQTFVTGLVAKKDRLEE
jgi:curli biogenesis system outer membrane secretion channel CsgG